MSKNRHQASKRDGGRFIAVPLSVLESRAYVELSHSARALLWDIAFQYKGNNNGKLLTGWRIMGEDRGWKSPATLQRAKEELLSSKLVAETRKGARPNKSSWVGLTWHDLDHTPEMDIAAKDFPRGLYRDPVQLVNSMSKRKLKDGHDPPQKIDVLNTVSVQERGSISTETVQGGASACTETVSM